MVTALALATAPAWAQPALSGAPRDVFELALAGPAADGPMVFGDQLRIIQAGEGFETRLVKGAPYSAETVTETVQTLADGNRIVHKTTGSVARDSEGRTRREQSLGGLLPFGPESPRRTIFIHDPAAGTSFALEPDDRIARRMGRGPMVWTKEDGSTHEGGGGAPTMVYRTVDRQTVRDKMPAPGRKSLAKPVTEPLGTKTIEGVEAVGTRTVVSIPAGEIGNERAIEMVTERWESPELKVVVLSRHSDPRFGETTYRLTGIQRGEPDRALFEVPADYTVKEGPGPGLRIEKRIGPPPEQ
jgi:hypothetical protein